MERGPVADAVADGRKSRAPGRPTLPKPKAPQRRSQRHPSPWPILVNGAGGFAGGAPPLRRRISQSLGCRMYRINVRTAAALCPRRAARR